MRDIPMDLRRTLSLILSADNAILNLGKNFTSRQIGIDMEIRPMESPIDGFDLTHRKHDAAGLCRQ